MRRCAQKLRQKLPGVAETGLQWPVARWLALTIFDERAAVKLTFMINPVQQDPLHSLTVPE